MRPRHFRTGSMVALLLTICSAVLSQSNGFDAERSRIAAERLQQFQALDALEQTCQARFAVTDCINRVRSQRRQQMAQLDQRLEQINSTQRAEQAEASRKSRREKIAQSRQRDAEQVPVAMPATSAAQTLAVRVPASGTGGHASAGRASKSVSAIDAVTREASKANFLKKQKDVQERRRQRDLRLKEPAPAHLALPVPP